MDKYCLQYQCHQYTGKTQLMQALQITPHSLQTFAFFSAAAAAAAAAADPIVALHYDYCYILFDC